MNKHQVFASKLQTLLQEPPYGGRTDIRPFVCPEYSLDCRAFIVGTNPATETSCFQELFSLKEGGFNLAEFGGRYPGNPNRGVRPRLVRIQTEASPVEILQTNVWAFECGDPDDVPHEFKNTEILEFLLSEIQPKSVLVHGADSVEYFGELDCFHWEQPLVVGFAGFAECDLDAHTRKLIWVRAIPHLTRVSYDNADAYGREIKQVCGGGEAAVSAGK